MRIFSSLRKTCYDTAMRESFLPSESLPSQETYEQAFLAQEPTLLAEARFLAERIRDLSSAGESRALVVGGFVRDADMLSLADIARTMEAQVQKIKSKQDESFTRMKGMMGLLPGFLAHAILTASGFLLYTLNVWTSLLGSPRDPFGSVMVTNIGSLGLEMAFAPLVPYSRIPLLIALGAVKEVPIVKNGQVTVGKSIKLCATFDHRLIDGVHASAMARTVKELFENPALLDKR
jgi:hypothetical protein